MSIHPTSIQRTREMAPCWISAADLLDAAIAIDKDPGVLHKGAELALCPSGTVQEHEARLIQSILEGALRDLRPNRAAVALARRWGGEEGASAYAWECLEILQFTGRVHALNADEVVAHSNHPMVAIYDTDVVIDLVKGLSIALMFLAESHIEVWRRQARSGRGAAYLPSAEGPIAIEVEALVATAYGLGEAVVAGSPINSANLRYGFTSFGGSFPSDFHPDVIKSVKDLAWARELPGAGDDAADG